VRFTSEQRLYEIIGWLEANGVPVADPHTFILEDGGMKTVDAAQLAFKRRNDPQGLLNPGKMKAWQA
jgi:FAD/FMN-containing dehydrogenase